MADSDRYPPKRTLGKKEAVRHLLHSAIRMIMAEEDPFPIHLLIHSADKLLIDFARKTGGNLAFDWDQYVKQDMKNEFFKFHRETYNYFKHADNDWESELPVHQITELNVVSLFICIVNFSSVYEEMTAHMSSFLTFFNIVSPDVLKVSIKENILRESINQLGNRTPSEMFSIMRESPESFHPGLAAERAQDCADNGDYFHTPVLELRRQSAERRS